MRIVLLILTLVVTQVGNAATITVDSLLDNTTSDGSCTLREALAAASANTGGDCVAGEVAPDLIVFADGLEGTLGVTEGTELVIQGSTTIRGPGSDRIIIDALRLTRVFRASQQVNETLSMEGLTVKNGNTSADGGGLLVDGQTQSVSLSDVVFEANFAGGRGGGLFVAGPESLTLSITGSRFDTNEADVEGAAMFVAPSGAALALTLQLLRTRVIENITLEEVPNVAVLCDGSQCDLEFDGMEAADNEGFHMDVRAEALSGNNRLIVRNSLFLGEDGMRYASEHGGIKLTTFQGELKVYNNSFSQNKAADFGALSISTGDSSWPALVAFNSFSFNVDRTQFNTRSIKANNATVRTYANLLQDGQCIADSASGSSITSLGWNYLSIGDAASCALAPEDEVFDRTWFFLDPGSWGNGPPVLQLWAGTEAIDAVPDCTIPALGIGDDGFALTTDQGGNPRPTNSLGVNQCDPGAMEAGPTLSIFESGNGGGSVGINPSAAGGFQAGSDRDGGGYFQPGTEVVLTPFPDSDSLFTGFTGACTGVGECTVTVDGPTEVDAGFELKGAVGQVNVYLTGTGTGRITSTPPGIDCPETCAAFYDINSNVTLTFSTGPGSNFEGWSGDCSGQGICPLTIDGEKTVIAEFDNPDVIFKNGLEAGLPQAR